MPEEVYLKSIRFWRLEAKRLSLTERMFFRDAIRTLLTWEALREEYAELDLLRKVLESEIQIVETRADSRTKTWADKFINNSAPVTQN
ncbi:MAG: hypothetical protein AB1390_06275 [Nitrospirota bacterium]